MMMNLFSTFDPSTNFNLSLNWMSALLFLFIIPASYWLIPSRLILLWLNILNYLHNELKILTPNKNSTLLFISLFTFIGLNNFMGLFPYIFTCTSHLNLTIALSLPLWISFMIFGWMNNTIHMLAHLVPQGAPNALLPFLVIIETTSNLIRPMTLAVRLTANMIAGHLLITLMSTSAPAIPTLMASILVITQIMLMILESAVAIIQSYVFSILSILYSSEVN